MKMLNGITRSQADALASLVVELREDWDHAGVLKALSDARSRGDGFRIAHAALYAAEDPAIRTPAVIAMAGDHWLRGRDIGTDDARYARCDQPGHSSYPATNCGACRADEAEQAGGVRPRIEAGTGARRPANYAELVEAARASAARDAARRTKTGPAATDTPGLG